MTEDKKLKKLVRARMAATGENYTRARNAILAEQKEAESCSDPGTD